MRTSHWGLIGIVCYFLIGVVVGSVLTSVQNASAHEEHSFRPWLWDPALPEGAVIHRHSFLPCAAVSLSDSKLAGAKLEVFCW